jgi:hypothetical protein
MNEDNLYRMTLILKAIVACQSLCAGMTAENMQREHLGEAMAYTRDDFAREVDFMQSVFEVHRL